MFILASSQYKPSTPSIARSIRLLPTNSSLSLSTPSYPPSIPTFPPVPTETTAADNDSGDTKTFEQGNAKLVSMVIPVLLARCREVLQRFVIDDRQSGQCPLPRYRLVEVFIIRWHLPYHCAATPPSRPPHTLVHRYPAILFTFTICRLLFFCVNYST